MVSFFISLFFWGAISLLLLTPPAIHSYTWKASTVQILLPSLMNLARLLMLIFTCTIEKKSQYGVPTLSWIRAAIGSSLLAERVDFWDVALFIPRNRFHMS